MSFDIDKEIDSFIENFDYERVHEVMELLEWKWLRPEYNYSVPSIEDMKAQNRHYLRMVAEGAVTKRITKDKKKASYFTGTGGFDYEATVYRDSPKIYLKMTFNVAEWNNYD